jgi:hypothetical protein
MDDDVELLNTAPRGYPARNYFTGGFMKKAVFTLAFAGFAAVSFANYTANIKDGNYYYNSGQYSKAMEYYSAAYKEKPGEQLGNFIDSLKLKISSVEEAKPLPDLNADAQKNNDSPNWLMWGLDAGFAVLGVVSYNYALASFKRYHELYNQWWGGWDSSAFGPMNAADTSATLWSYAAGGSAGAVIAITGSMIADALIFSKMREGKKPDAAILPYKDGIKLTLNYGF